MAESSPGRLGGQGIIDWELTRFPQKIADLHAPVHSEVLCEFVPRDLAVSKDLCEQATTDCLATMDRNNGTATVRMAKEMVAALCSEDLETQLPKGLDGAR